MIFDASLRKRLLDTQRGPYLQQHLHLMQEKPWIRHDEHYHVDFDVSCQKWKKP